MILCTRCELLFQECRPLRDSACPKQNPPAPVSAPEPDGPRPDTDAPPEMAAAVVFDHHTRATQIKPILAADFYWSEE